MDSDGGEEDDESTRQKSAKSRRSRAMSAPKLPNPRNHPMAKVVGKTRVLIGKAKKSQNSKTFIDPEQSELGSALILQKKRQAAKLEKGKEKQTHVNSEMDAKVMEYFRKNPAKDIETADNPLTLYENMRQQMHVIDNDALFVENSNNDYF